MIRDVPWRRARSPVGLGDLAWVYDASSLPWPGGAVIMLGLLAEA